jgi:hypothetical protein
MSKRRVSLQTMKTSLIFLLAFCRPSYSFVLPTNAQRSSKSTACFGIGEWRDTFFNFPGAGDDRRIGTESGPPPKEVCILPFPFVEVLLQGETKQLRLYEERFIKLFDDAMKNHSGVVAMGTCTCPSSWLMKEAASSALTCRHRNRFYVFCIGFPYLERLLSFLCHRFVGRFGHHPNGAAM